MKLLPFLFLTFPLFGGDLERFLDIKANYTQRNEACLALRGNKEPDVVKAMRESLSNSQLQACAGDNLRIAGATNELIEALGDKEPATRAIAARELGTMQRPEFLPLLRQAAEDHDVLAASNALEALVRYEDHSSAPQLREIALKSGVLTTLALNALIQWQDPELLPIARQLMSSREPGDQLAAVRALGLTGDATDLPKLRDLAKDETALGSGGRGFGLMPSISLSKAAQTAITSIEKRAT